jgi:cytochrome c oxidase assembly protein subunit 15
MWFRRFSILTICTTYLLILVGGIVRSTGSGMGCPDWPKCFGTWVPPTHESQLPSGYQQIFGAKLKGEVVFNAAKTWTEYLNRLLGVLTGLLIFATLLASVSYWRRDRAVVGWSAAAFVMVAFQGWLGSKVVSTELKPVLITLHMVVAILIVFVLLYAWARAQTLQVAPAPIRRSGRIQQVVLIGLGLSLLQIVLGTQVREAVDEVAKVLGDAGRAQWVSELGLPFYVHRSFSILVFAAQVGLVILLRKEQSTRSLVGTWANLVLIVTAAEILTGIVMAYFAIPAYLQPVHLTLSVVMIGLQFLVFLHVRAARGRAMPAAASYHTYP